MKPRTGARESPGVTVRHRGMETGLMETILTFASWVSRKIETLLLLYLSYLGPGGLDSDLIWFVFIGSPTETATNPSGFTFRGLPPEFGYFFGKLRAHPRQTPPTAY